MLSKYYESTLVDVELIATCALRDHLVHQQWHALISWNTKLDFFLDGYTILISDRMNSMDRVRMFWYWRLISDPYHKKLIVKAFKKDGAEKNSTRGIWKVLHIRPLFKSQRLYIQLIYTKDLIYPPCRQHTY